VGLWPSRLLVTLLVIGFSFTAPARADVSYTYDDLGRVKTVRSASGEVAEYVYDSVGNIVEVRRIASGELAVTGFDPASGAVGTGVVINGSGFSATAANNSVTFNGTATTVTSATTTRLTATVPIGAITGPIAVTVGASTATSRDLFTVVSGAGRLPPTITNFTPNIGPAGTSVAVTGTNFDTAVGATRVELNGTQATSSVASASSLTMTVPAKTGSGAIRVSTAGGTAVSLADFIVPPADIPQASIVAFARSNIGQTAMIAINSQNSYGLVLVEGSQGNYVSLDLATFAPNPSTATISYTVYTPNNTVFVSGKTVSATDRTIHLPPFPKSGTYTVAFFSGAATVTIGARPALMTSVFRGTARSISTGFVGQSVRVGYQGAASDSLGLEIAGMSTAPAGQPLTVTMFKPDGTLFQSITTSTVGGFLQLPVLPVAGLYTIVIGPAGTATTSLQLTVEPGISLTVNGGSVAATIATAGESARYVYTAPATLPVQVQVDTLQLGGASALVTVYKPDGTSIGSITCTAAPCAIAILSQTTIGPFSVVAQPTNGATGSLSVSVTASDVVGALTPGTPVTVVVAQNKKAYFTFAATAGTSPSVSLTLTPPPSGTAQYAVSWNVIKPDGTLLRSSYCYVQASPNNICGVAPYLADLPLSQSGTYTVVVQPSLPTGMSSTSITATLSGV